MRLQWMLLVLGVATLVSFCCAAMAQVPLTPKTLRAQLAANPTGADAERLAEQVRAWFGKDNLLKGANAKIEMLDVAWAIELPGTDATQPPSVLAENGLHVTLTPIGDTGVFAAALPG